MKHQTEAQTGITTNDSLPMPKKYSLYKDSKTTDAFDKIKYQGQIYTPDYLVKIILDRGGYSGANILQKHVIDNSCGNGQFMIEVVDRYCKTFLDKSNNLETLKRDLEQYIHAIEIEKSELATCKKRCDKIVSKYDIKNVKWDFTEGDAIETTKYNNKMDYVVGNPPYVRVHNLEEKTATIRQHLFCKNGMTDLYILFYEIGIKMLSNSGTLVYISPSSFFTSAAGTEMRNYLNNNNLLTSVCDLKHFQAFSVTSYTAIVCLRKNRKESNITYAEFNERTLSPMKIDILEKDDYVIDGKFYFSNKKSLAFLKSVFNCPKKQIFAVKNGYATLADKVFINNFDFSSTFIIPAVKASRAKWTKILFPYDKNGKLYEQETLFQDENIKKYLLKKKKQLENRTIEKDKDKYWYAFGRSQAINDTFKNKLALNTMIRTKDDLKLVEVESGKGIYGGLYIISDTMPITKIKSLLLDDEFSKYISLLGKYKSGGYYTYSSKDITAYLNYKLSKEEYVN